MNWAQSELVPTQRFVFLGEAYDLVTGQPLQTALFLLRLLGVLNSVANIIPYRRLHMRPLQLFLIAQWSMALQPLCFLVGLNEVFFHHLVWWEDRHNLPRRVPLTSPKSLQHCVQTARPQVGEQPWTPETLFQEHGLLRRLRKA